MIKTSQCMFCKHNKSVDRTPYCDAFRGEMPTEILLGDVKHDKPYPGDHGILFEEEEEEYDDDNDEEED